MKLIQRFKKAFKIALKKVKAFLSELANFITDVFVPAISFLGVLVILLPIPKRYKLNYKKFEELVKRIGRTAEDVEAEIRKFK